jgi:hypothetical protein
MEKLGQPSNTTVFIYIHLDFLNQQNDTRIGTDFFYVAVIVVLSILYVCQIVPSNIPVPVSYRKPSHSLAASSYFSKRPKFQDYTDNRKSP